MKSDIRGTLKSVFHVGPGFGKKTAAIIVTEILTGLFLSFLVEVNFGTDPCSTLSVVISDRFGILMGTWNVIFNLCLFVAVFALSGFRYFGVGTLANMTLIGYACDFGRWFFRRILPDFLFTQFPARGITYACALLGFITCCGVYMNMDAGLVPYDAIPLIISQHLPRVPFTLVRMCYDFSVIGIAALLGGRVPVGCFLMALFLGPVIGGVGRWMSRSVPGGAGA